MRILLDTNILIHREAPVVIRQTIGLVFNWLDRLKYNKCVHPVSIEEIERHEDYHVRTSFAAKVASYRILRSPAPMMPEVQALSDEVDTSENDRNDSKILNELYAQRVDYILTEDRGIARKAERLGIADRVFTIDAFLEKVVAENPDLIEYRIPTVQKTLFGNVNLTDPFFDSFRTEYPGFNRWFNHKSEEPAYVCLEERGNLVAFLYLKIEDEREPYHDITPHFLPKRRLKIGTFKVELNGFKLGERFLKIVFDNALKQRIAEIYVTIFPNSAEQVRLIRLLEDFGFIFHGEKHNTYGNERVYVRDMNPRFNAIEPRLTFPFISRSARAFLVPIYPQYHTELFPDSILRTESPADFVEYQPHRNSIRKVYVSRSYFRDLISGDIIIFYRTGGYHRAVVTTIGVVENAHFDIQSEEQFISLCRKRSVFSDGELIAQWRYKPHYRPFIVDFLYAYSFPKRPNLAALIQNEVIPNVESAPRCFERISNGKFETIFRLSESDPRLVVN
jgi:predicted nucleic acid-binding protein